MSPLRKIQLEQLRDERRGQIKVAAIKVFARRGFKATRTNMIAAEASISEGLIYRYFKSKDELFIELVAELLAEGKRETENVPYLPGTPFEQLRELTRNILDENYKEAFMFILRARRDEDVPEPVARLFAQNSDDKLLENLIPVFVKGQEAGLFIEGVPRQLLGWYFSIIYSLILEEADLKFYGIPAADFLMRVLARNPTK